MTLGKDLWWGRRKCCCHLIVLAPLYTRILHKNCVGGQSLLVLVLSKALVSLHPVAVEIH